MNIGGIFLALQGAVSQGILWGVLVLGVYITYKILDIADLTVDGSFALGGCICATFVVGYGMNPFLALIISTLAGMIAGADFYIRFSKFLRFYREFLPRLPFGPSICVSWEKVIFLY